MPHSDEFKERVKYLWKEEGLSASQVARVVSKEFQIHYTRNAVVGVVHRAGLQRGDMHQPRPRTYVPPIKKEPKPKAIKQEIIVVEQEPARDETGELVSLETISDKMCRWPVGDPTERNFHYCGNEPDGKSPYCASHHQKAIGPTQSLPVRRRYAAHSIYQ